MAQFSSIEWTTHTFNPWWGCTTVSEGCRFCYAQNLATRYGHDVWGKGKERRKLSDGYWEEPLRWNNAAGISNAMGGERPRVFCASMADVFDPEAPEGELERLWELIRATPELDWLLLTKRPGRIEQSLPDDWAQGYANVWLGASVEDNKVADRARTLAQIPAHLRFLSLEPLIGPVDKVSYEGIHWAIVGGESGARPRPMQMEWVHDIHAACRENDVAFFFKQLGTYLAREMRCTDRKGGKWSELPVDLRIREIPGVAHTFVPQAQDEPETETVFGGVPVGA